MGELEVPERELEYFSSSARSGRRNALPEIEVEMDDPGATKLADRLSDMSAHCDHCEHGTSQENQPGPSTPQTTTS